MTEGNGVTRLCSSIPLRSPGFLTSCRHLCCNEINGMHTFSANASFSPVRCIDLPIPALRIIGSNSLAGNKA